MRSGIGLLHIFSLHDPHQFNRQTRDVFHHYIELEAGLKKLFMEQGLQADHDCKLIKYFAFLNCTGMYLQIC